MLKRSFKKKKQKNDTLNLNTTEKQKSLLPKKLNSGMRFI